MALFRFTLDGNILTDEPEGWQDIVSELKRDKESKGQLLLMDLTIRFNGKTDGYDILKPLIDCNGFCSFSTLVIEESCNDDNLWTEIYEGIIFYTDIKEYLTPCVLECKLTDNSFFAKIDNNKNIEAFINVGRSKNDVVINPAQQYQILMFDVLSGSDTVQINTFPVWSCFEFIIDYMTDGEMGFVSDYFYGNLSGLTDGQFMTITTGEQIRLGQAGNPTKFPFISFQKLFDEVNKKINIGFSIETSATGEKVMRIEPASYFYNSGTSVTLNDVKGIIKSVNISELYSKLRVGSTETLPFAVNDVGECSPCFPTGITFVGFQEETFTLTGKCNIDAELNLVSEWIIDTNIIQDILNPGNTGYDDDIIFVMADYIAATPRAIQYDVFSNAPPYFYNGFLRNSEVTLRWLGAVPNSIALYLGNGDNEFMASSTSDVALGTICATDTPYQDDFNPPNNDPSGNYNNATFTYTAPATGLYSFQTISNVFYAEDTGVMTQIIFSELMVNAVSVFTHQQNIPHGNSTFNFTFSNIYLQGGDAVTIRTSDLFCLPNVPPYYTLTLLASSSFACINATTGGGIFQYYNPEDFKAYMYEFDYPLTFADFQTIKANPLKLLAFNDGVNFISAWIENMRYFHKEGRAKFVCTNAVTNICE